VSCARCRVATVVLGKCPGACNVMRMTFLNVPMPYNSRPKVVRNLGHPELGTGSVFCFVSPHVVLFVPIGVARVRMFCTPMIDFVDWQHLQTPQQTPHEWLSLVSSRSERRTKTRSTIISSLNRDGSRGSTPSGRQPPPCDQQPLPAAAPSCRCESARSRPPEHAASEVLRETSRRIKEIAVARLQ
jgi:hypothetical protein